MLAKGCRLRVGKLSLAGTAVDDLEVTTAIFPPHVARMTVILDAANRPPPGGPAGA
jgi:hypothetical protein